MPREHSSSAPALQPPHNLDAELGLLGALLYDNRLLDDLPDLDGGHFFEPVNGRIFEAAKAKIQNHQTADGVTLLGQFSKDGALQEIGGTGYLATVLASATPIKATAIHYARLIRSLATRRALRDVSLDIAHMSVEREDISEDELLGLAEIKLREIEASGEGGNLFTLRDAAEEVHKTSQEIIPTGLRTGLSKIDRMTNGLHAPDLVILAGRPGMGKTSLAVNLATNVADQDVIDEDGVFIRKRVVLFVSLEMDRDQLAGRVLSRRSYGRGRGMSFPYESLRALDPKDRPNPDVIRGLLQARIPKTLIIDERGRQTVASIAATCRRVIRQFGHLDLVAIDYLQLLRDPAIRSDNRILELGQITADLKAMGKRFKVPVLALAQLSRAVEQRPDKRPILSDLRESGTIEQDADQIMFLYRQFYYISRNEPKHEEGEEDSTYQQRYRAWQTICDACVNEVEVIEAKNRHGPTGLVKLWCDLAFDVVADEPIPTRL